MRGLLPALGGAVLLFATSSSALAAPPLTVPINSCKAKGSTVTGYVNTYPGSDALGNMRMFLGIPYAAPPVGDLRWRAPRPAARWSGVREATRFGPDCMQLPFPSDAAPLGTEPAEDCLTINVWRPAESRPDEKLPVLVWLYGGGFVNGGSSPSVYDGSAFARRGLVFVSFNYRVGRFGFFAHPALTAAGEGPLNNYGFLDQAAALRWVRQNISAFGGDPGQVTIMGESAGGGSVLNLMVSPMSRDLFQRAIVMSGGGRSAPGAVPLLRGGTPEQPSAEQIGVNFAQSVGISGTGPEALAALRALPAETVRGDLNLTALFTPSRPPTYGGPVADGAFLPNMPDRIIAAGQATRIPVMIGTTGADIGFAFARSKDELFAGFGPRAGEARIVYDPHGDRDLPMLTSMVGADRAMHEPARFIAGEVARQGQPTWLYRFSYVAHSMRPQWPAAPHATDIPFFFDTVAAKYGADLTPADAETARVANAYFANFARTGDPNASGLPAWRRFDPERDNLMDFTLDRGPVAGADPWRSRLDLAAAGAQAR